MDNPENIMELSDTYVGTNPMASSFELVDKAIERGASEYFWGLYSIVNTSIIPYGKKMIVDIALINDIGETISAVSVNIFGQAGTLTNEHRNYHGWYDHVSSASIKFEQDALRVRCFLSPSHTFFISYFGVLKQV